MTKADYPQCRTCKHYKGGTCGNPKMASRDPDGLEGCSGDSVSYWNRGESMPPRYVGPDFGCVHHSDLEG